MYLCRLLCLLAAAYCEALRENRSTNVNCYYDDGGGGGGCGGCGNRKLLTNAKCTLTHTHTHYSNGDYMRMMLHYYATSDLPQMRTCVRSWLIITSHRAHIWNAPLTNAMKMRWWWWWWTQFAHLKNFQYFQSNRFQCDVSRQRVHSNKQAMITFPVMFLFISISILYILVIQLLYNIVQNRQMFH